jgi:hypothetical protein
MNKYHIIFLIGLIGCAEEVTVIKNDPPPIIVLPPEEEQFPEVCESQQCTEDSQCSFCYTQIAIAPAECQDLQD